MAQALGTRVRTRRGRREHSPDRAGRATSRPRALAPGDPPRLPIGHAGAVRHPDRTGPHPGPHGLARCPGLTRTNGGGRGLPMAGILWSSPQARHSTDRHKQKNAAPTAGNLSIVECRPLDGSRPAHPVRPAPRPRSPGIRSPIKHAHATSCRPRHNAPSPCPMRGVPAERRQESCQSKSTAPSGRPPSGLVV